MDQQHLRDSLENLHRELSQAPSLDERGQQLLASVRHDLDRLNANPSAATRQGGNQTAQPLSPAEHNEIQSRWQSAVVDFEGSHPQIARGLEQMANILSNFGL